MKPRTFWILFLGLIIASDTAAQWSKQSVDSVRQHTPKSRSTDDIISTEKVKSGFCLASSGLSAPMYVSSEDYPGVIRAFTDLQADIKRVTNTLPVMMNDLYPGGKEIIIAGTIGKSPIIDQLVKNRKINVDDISGRWESYLIQVVNNPFRGVKKALVIVGSDKRGTIYGIYEISRQIGVSPWYWWADVTPLHRDDIFIKPGRYLQGEPSVKYRGIFLNDEAPALTNWVAWKYGMVAQSDNPPVPEGVANYGHEFYSKIFEVILRLKGNYLWPAMWNNAFNEDDTLNPALADEYGIVMGNSHQEPMLRAQKEWDRRYKKTLGYWNYSKYPDTINAFWREGIKRNRKYESIITIGLRGADDTEMDPGGPEANMHLLEKIVGVQRKIIAEEVNPDVTKVPQLWCLYKEVQDYYNRGMRVPDDVTLLWAEDNWGNIRRLPTPEERKRSGGAGIYYHFDYHGGPRSYQWINTNPIAKVWDQMSLAKQYGADRIWIVNVGHFKGYEFPLEFFMTMAWDKDRINGENISEYTEEWASEQFGKEYAKEIATIIRKYTMFNGRRKPELLAPDTYSFVNYHEAENVVSEYKSLVTEAERINSLLPEKLHDAYYQMVLFPVKASSLVNELYFTAGKNALYAKQHRAMTNDLASEVQKLFREDTILMGYYNRTFAGGRWNHFMDQTHLGYTNWADPPVNSLRAIDLKNIDISEKSCMALSIEGSTESYDTDTTSAFLPEFDRFNRQSRYIEVFNRGSIPFEFFLTSDRTWIIADTSGGTVDKEKRVNFSVDWKKISGERDTATITVEGAGSKIKVYAVAFNPSVSDLNGFIETGGYVSVEAAHYSKKIDADNCKWQYLEDYGKTLSGMRATSETDIESLVPGKSSPCLEYQMYFFTCGEIEARLTLSPSLNYFPGKDITIGVSFDNEKPQILTVVPGNYFAHNGNLDWENSVMYNARIIMSKHNILKAGQHTLKVWMTEPGVVLEKIVINTGGLKDSYLGPPESYRER